MLIYQMKFKRANEKHSDYQLVLYFLYKWYLEFGRIVILVTMKRRNRKSHGGGFGSEEYEESERTNEEKPVNDVVT